MQSQSLPVHHGLRQFLEEYELATNSRNFDLVAPFIDEEAIYWFSDGSHNGLEEIRLAFEKTWKIIKNETYTISDVHWVLLTDVNAVCLYLFNSTGTVGGKKQSYSGRGTNVLTKKNGNWKIVHEHLSKQK